MQRIGRYEVLDHLASGGMGQVYLARTTGLGGFERRVVVKTLESGAEDEQFVAMFLDEARLVGTLHHQYITPVYEVGCDDEGRYFLVMDYIHGETAEAVWRRSFDRGDAVPLAFALTVGSAVAAALAYAHTLCSPDGTPLGIVHRDVSLSNVMIGHDGAVKLIDFGIAKSAHRTSQTQAGVLKGKIAYLAPEQILHKAVDHRTDIFALGIVLYELTTMTRAFRDTTDYRTLERITRGQIMRPSQLVVDYPPELERIVMTALEVAPDQRFQHTHVMGRELEALARRLGLQLGHTAIVDAMAELFPTRRRLARASSEVSTGPRPPMIDEDDRTPVEAIEHDESTTPVPIADVPTAPLPAMPPVVRRPPTITAEIVRPPAAVVARPTAIQTWWILGLFVAIALVVALVLGSS